MLALGQHHHTAKSTKVPSTALSACRLQSTKTILRQIWVQESAFQSRKEESSEIQLLPIPDLGNSTKDIFFSSITSRRTVAIDSHFLRQVSAMRTRIVNPGNFFLSQGRKKCFLLPIKYDWEKETFFFSLLCCFQVLRNKTKTSAGTWIAGVSGPGLTLIKHMWLCIA